MVNKPLLMVDGSYEPLIKAIIVGGYTFGRVTVANPQEWLVDQFPFLIPRS